MNIISEQTIFDYMEIENLGDLERLKLFLDNIEDSELCKKLENERRNGRNDFPVRVMLNLIYSMKIFGHRSVESFRRELSRNSQLRRACGLKDEEFMYLGKRKKLIPEARVFTLFFKKLTKHQEELDSIFENDVKFMYDNLENFGEDCALDGKLLDSYAKRENSKATDKEEDKDYRRDNDASWTCKTYNFADGTKKSTWHYGYESHILCDANYGLPIWHKEETASVSEQRVANDMLEDLEKNHKYVLDKMKNFLADAGYDDGKRNKLLKDKYDINPLVDNRHMWKEEKLKEIDNQPLAYNEDGEVFYIKNIKTGEYEKLKYLGYDKQRKCLRYGFKYNEQNKVFRVPLNIDRRIFLPIARDSDKFKRLYKKRTEVERLNGRLDRDYMFNDHFIRGKKKMNMMVTLSFIVMLTMAKGHIKNNQANIRSLVKV
jgi:hypothetical protein